MYQLFKKSRFVLAITLFSQAITLFFLFILQVAKRRSLAAAFLAVSCFEGLSATYLLWQLKEEEQEARLTAKQAKEMKENPHTFDIPLDEKASEKEFK